MTTVVRASLSKKNKYWISKHRYYELKHFCRQYSEWKEYYISLENPLKSQQFSNCIEKNTIRDSDPTLTTVMQREKYLRKMALVEKAAKDADPALANYILKAATDGASYTYLSTVMGIPCSKDTFYDRYRRFYWLLDKNA